MNRSVLKVSIMLLWVGIHVWVCVSQSTISAINLTTFRDQ